jgi:hypothetical protein
MVRDARRFSQRVIWRPGGRPYANTFATDFLGISRLGVPRPPRPGKAAASFPFAHYEQRIATVQYSPLSIYKRVEFPQIPEASKRKSSLPNRENHTSGGAARITHHFYFANLATTAGTTGIIVMRTNTTGVDGTGIIIITTTMGTMIAIGKD